MTREELIKKLNYTMKKHEHDRVATFGTNISLMCKDMLDYLKQEPKCESCELNRQRFMQTLDVAFELGKMSAEPQDSEDKIIRRTLEPKTENYDADFLEFLFNVINPNEMEKYMAMYNSPNIPAEGSSK